MKKRIILSIGLALFVINLISAQEFTADGYWKMEHNPAYLSLKIRKESGDSINDIEKKFLFDYKIKLDTYFDKLSDDEKSSYYKNRKNWEGEPGKLTTPVIPQNTEVYAGEKSAYTRYLISSGFFGFIYGISADYIFRIDQGGGVMGVPLLTSGISTLLPVFTVKDKKITYNSLELSLHGKTAGFLQGVALSVLFAGNKTGDNEKLLLGVATLSSIGAGRAGFILGKEKPWTRGRAALYSHYGILMPFEGLAVDALFRVRDPRIFAATFIAFGAGGYILADRISDWNDFTPGDITATKALTWMNGGLGFCIMSDISENSESDPALVMIPAAGALAGSLVSHIWLKDANLTTQQGRNSALVASGGAAIGLGLSAIFKFDRPAPRYILSYLSGMGAYSVLVTSYIRSNRQIAVLYDKRSRWDINFMPQNILINKQIAIKPGFRPGNIPIYLPAFTASVNF